MHRVRFHRSLDSVAGLSQDERDRLAPVAERYAFRANDYTLGLIDWDDPADPVRRIVIPDPGELEPFGRLDPSQESTNYVAPGCQHKYRDTALLVVSETCGGQCRFCFRKRLFLDGNAEAGVDPGPGIAYIRRTRSISNVLLTGGDPLMLSTRRLGAILAELRGIEHVGIIRIGSKLPAYNPLRISEDPELLETLARHSHPDRRLYVMTHFNHPRELSPEALRALDLLHRAGVILCNQTPILRGINDDPAVLADLVRRLSYAGATPYYFFQCRPTAGNRPYTVPLVESHQLLARAVATEAGLARRARLVMSHASGKVEVAGVTADKIYCRYQRARDPRDEGRFFACKRDDRAYWLDDLLGWEHTPRPAAHAAHRGAAPGESASIPD